MGIIVIIHYTGNFKFLSAVNVYFNICLDN